MTLGIIPLLYGGESLAQTVPTFEDTPLPPPSPIFVPSPASSPILLEEETVFDAIPSEESYTLGEGDRIRIDVFNGPEVSREYIIAVNGTLNLPLIGTVSFEQLTLEEASEILTVEYSPFFKRTSATVTLVTPRQLRIAVSGAVNRPGSYVLSPIRGNEPAPGLQLPNVNQAIQAAEGIRLNADLRSVELHRQRRNGQVETLTLNLWQLLQEGNIEHNLTLRDGDSLFIPTSNDLSLGEMWQVYNTTFYSNLTQDFNITVVGEVIRPGSYILRNNAAARRDDRGLPPTLARGIQVAGGMTSQADVRRVELQRLNFTENTTQTITINLWELLQGESVLQNTILQNGDTIIIPTAETINPEEVTQFLSSNFAPETIRVSVIGEVKSPGSLNIPPNTLLNQALLEAGGFDDVRARRNKVELIRLNPNGTVSRRTIPVNFAQGLDPETNPTLQNNDIVIVNRQRLAWLSDGLRTLLTPLQILVSPFNQLFETLNFIENLNQ